MANHTAEPWKVGIVGGVISGDFIIAQPFKERGYGPLLDDETMHENSRRIVACVNACAGIETKELEESGIVSRRNIAKSLLDELISTVGDLKEICSERKIPMPDSTIKRAEAEIEKAMRYIERPL